jgi:quercetin dioxygenase-like cupin family protein
MGRFAMAQRTGSPPGQQIIRKDLLTAIIAGGKDVSRVQIKEVDFAPSQRSGLHLHPCLVVGYVATGTILFQIEGGPAKSLQAGSAFFEPANVKIAHFDNASPQEPATFVAFCLLGKDDQALIAMLE